MSVRSESSSEGVARLKKNGFFRLQPNPTPVLQTSSFEQFKLKS